VIDFDAEIMIALPNDRQYIKSCAQGVPAGIAEDQLGIIRDQYPDTTNFKAGAQTE
jgi:hypothetical protein